VEGKIQQNNYYRLQKTISVIQVRFEAAKIIKQKVTFLITNKKAKFAPPVWPKCLAMPSLVGHN